MKFRVITPPTAEPITLAEARDHLRVTPYGSPAAHPDDDLILALIVSARDWCEQYLRRALATQTIAVVVDELNGAIELPYSPAQSVDSITYVDTDGATQTLATSVYQLDNYSEPPVVKLKYDQDWPTTRDQEDAATITYVAGYTDGESPNTYPLPGAIRAAMLLIIGNLYENRQENVMNGNQLNYNSLPMGVYALLQPYRLGMGL
jgi:uncharacterized phiE125 gp8 family phage protein